MGPPERSFPPSRLEGGLAMAAFALALIFSAWGVHVGWQSKNLPGGEFRQAQTALTTYWIQADHDFLLAYPTPVLGRPWSLPMEFPFYQWTVVAVSGATHWSLIKAGRAVSIACFYLCLPAVFLLLRRWEVAPGRRWLVLAVIVTCPFYIYYARAFLMETMALMFSLWFWVAFERAVAERNRGWLALAVIAGTGAGLVKVTTYLLYLLPAGCWALIRLWVRRKDTWRVELGWMVAATALPFAATLWWMHFADGVKAQNPLAHFLISSNLRDFNWGTMAAHFSAELWTAKGKVMGEELSWWPVFALTAILAATVGRVRWRELAVCAGTFAAALVIFPVLYAVQSYYFAANTVLLLMAVGLALVALAESAAARWLVWLAVGLVLGGQAWRYTDYYFPGQSAISQGGDGLTRSLRTLTKPDEVVVVLGQDWSSMLPFYSQRRALMFRNDAGEDPALVEQALANLGTTKIGALVIAGRRNGQQWLIDRAAARGLEREPLYEWRDCTVYVPRARRTEMMDVLLTYPFDEVNFAPNVVVPRAKLADRWVELALLHPWERQGFAAMHPHPTRFFSQFGPAMDGSSGQPMYGAHPITRLVFSLPAGPHTLRSTLQMPLDAYRMDLRDSDATDGVEVSLFALGPRGERRELATRYFDPRHNLADRGASRSLIFKFALPVAGEVELFFGPGPAGNLTRDWIQLGPLSID